MDNAKNTAQTIAALFGNDGTTWELEDGRTLEAVCGDYPHTTEYQDRGMADGCVRYDFADGSAIVTFPNAWDVALGQDLGCFCPASSEDPASRGHWDGCSVREEAS